MKKSAKEKFKERRRAARFRHNYVNFDHMYEEQMPEEKPEMAAALCARGYRAAPLPILECWKRINGRTDDPRNVEWLKRWFHANMTGEWPSW